MKTKTFYTHLADEDPETVVFGDWHGDLSYALQALERVYDKYPDVGVLYHVGDFGVWPGADQYLTAVSQSIEAAGKKMVVTGGNHEDWTQWNHWTLNNSCVFDYNNSGLIFLPKVIAWEHAGLTFASVGGASSIDRRWRAENVSWWRDEEISYGIVDTLKRLEINRADVLITHESSNTPVDPIQARLDDKFVQSQWPLDSLEASERQREYVSEVVDHLQPSVHAHGHWHIPHNRKTEELLTVSLGDNRTTYAENAFHYSW